MKNFNKWDKLHISNLNRMRDDESLTVVKVYPLFGKLTADLISKEDYYYDKEDEYNLDYIATDYTIYDTHKEAFYEYQKLRYGKVLIKIED